MFFFTKEKCKNGLKLNYMRVYKGIRGEYIFWTVSKKPSALSIVVTCGYICVDLYQQAGACYIQALPTSQLSPLSSKQTGTQITILV